MQKGLKSVSMDDVARHMGMSKKTIYQYVKDKKELVFNVIQQHFEKDQTNCQFILNSQPNPINQMLIIGKNIAANFKSMHPSLIFDLRKYFPRSWELFLNYRSNVVYHAVKSNITNGIEQGYYRQDLHPEIISRIYLDLTESVVKIDYSNVEYNFGDAIREMILYHLHAICSEKGLEYLSNHKNIITNLPS